jgi:hypothetical protein
MHACMHATLMGVLFMPFNNPPHLNAALQLLQAIPLLHQLFRRLAPRKEGLAPARGTGKP